MTPTDVLREHESTLGGHLKIRFVSDSKDLVIGEMDAGRTHLTLGGRVHGGAIMAFADTVAAYATVLNLPSGQHGTTTIESKTNFFRAASPGVLRAEAKPLHRGRSTMVWQTTITGPGGEQVAIVTQTQFVIPPKA